MKYPQDTVTWTWGGGGGVAVLEGVWKEGRDLGCVVRSQMPASLFQFTLVRVSLCLCTLEQKGQQASGYAAVRACVCMRVRTYAQAISLRLATQVVVLSPPFLDEQLSECSFCF